MHRSATSDHSLNNDRRHCKKMTSSSIRVTTFNTIWRLHNLLNEISHFHLRPLLRHVGLHLRIGVVDDGKEHVLYGQEVRSDG